MFHHHWWFSTDLLCSICICHIFSYLFFIKKHKINRRLNRYTVSPHVCPSIYLMTWFPRNQTTFQNRERRLQNDERQTNSCWVVMTLFSLNYVSKTVPQERVWDWMCGFPHSLTSRKNANRDMNGRLNEILGQSGSLHNTFAGRPFFIFTISVVVFI